MDRIAAHETIQKIYADHSSQDYDIFISVLRIRDASSMASLSTVTDFSIAKHLPELTIRSFQSERSKIVDSVALCEAALISYFKPRYNEHHKHRFPSPETKVVKLLTKYRYSNLNAILDDGGAGIQLWSEARTASRYHFARYRMPGPTDVSAEEYAASAQRMEAWSGKLLADMQQAAQASAVTLACIPADTPERFRK